MGVPEVSRLYPLATLCLCLLVANHALPRLPSPSPLPLLSSLHNLIQDSSFISKGDRICSHLLAKGIFGARVLFLSPGSYSNHGQGHATFIIPKKRERPGPRLWYCYYSVYRWRHRGTERFPPPKSHTQPVFEPEPGSLMQGLVLFPGPDPSHCPPSSRPGSQGDLGPYSLKYLVPLFKHVCDSVMAAMTIK